MSTMTVSNRFAKEERKTARFGITRGQAILFFAAFTIFFYTLTELVFASGDHTVQQAQMIQPVKEIVVQPGDSLWELAVTYKSDPKMDVRDMVYAIQKLNKLESAIIYPGQSIQIPVGN